MKFDSLKDIILTEQRGPAIMEGKIDDLIHQYVETKKIPPHVFDELVSIDPTENKKYLPWMAKRMSEERSHVNITRLKKYIPMFDDLSNKNKLQGAERDIFQYKTIEALYDRIKHFEENPELAKTEGDKEAEIKAGAEKVFENDRCVIVKPKTKEASCLYGAKTRWCTAATEYDNRFNEYYFKRGVTLYYVIPKQGIDIKVPHNYDKVAVAVETNGKTSVFLADDKFISYEEAKPWFRKLGITDL